jgi:hypothetical protein
LGGNATCRRRRGKPRFGRSLTLPGASPYLRRGSRVNQHYKLQVTAPLAGKLLRHTHASVHPIPLSGLFQSESPATADILVETLIAWGATHVFGLVGEGIPGIIEAVRKRQSQIRYVVVRHEEAAASARHPQAGQNAKLLL